MLKFLNKYFVFFIFIIMFLSLIFLFTEISQVKIVFADDVSIQEQLELTTNDGLSALDFSALEEIINTANQDSKNLFGDISFFDKLKSLINGEVQKDFGAYVTQILKIFLDNILDILPILCLIVSISILFSILSNFKSDNNGIKDMVHFLCYGTIIIIITTLITQCITQVTGTLTNIKTQMEIVFPILLTTITAIGGATTVSAFQPSVAILSTGIIELFGYILIPLFLISYIFTIANNLSNNLHFTKFISVSQSIFKWIIGLVFMLYFALVSINGIVANSVDGISIKTAKYTLKSYVPYVGGYMSDGFDIIMSSSVLIKNAVGTCALILMLATTFSPLIKILVVMFALKITGAILEPISDKRISNFIFSIGKILNMLIACLISMIIMYFLIIGLLMSVCNLF